MTSHLRYTRWTINSFWIFFKVQLPTMMLVIDVQEKCRWQVLNYSGISHIIMSPISLWAQNSLSRLKNIPTPEPFIGKSPRLLLITELGPRWNLRSLFNLSLLRFNHCLIFIAIYKQKLLAVESSNQFNHPISNLPKLKLVGLVHLSQQVLLKNISTEDIWHNLWLITNFIPKKCVNPENFLRSFHAFWKFFGELSLKSTFVFKSQGIIPGFSIGFCTVTRCQTTDIIWIKYPQNI